MHLVAFNLAKAELERRHAQAWRDQWASKARSPKDKRRYALRLSSRPGGRRARANP